MKSADKKKLTCPSCGSGFVNLFPAGECEACGELVCGHCLHHDHPDFNGILCQTCLVNKTPLGRLAQLDLEELILIVSDPDSPDRTLAVRLLAERPYPKVVDTLCRALNSNRIDVKREAAVALGKTGKQEAVPSLIKALEDPAPPVRSRAAAALANLNATQAIPVLKRMLDDPSLQVTGHAVKALTKLMGKAAGEILADLSQNHLSSYICCEALNSLAGIDPDKGLSAAIASLENPKKDVRICACKTLNRLGDIRAVPALQELIDSEPAASVRITASAVLKNILSPEKG